MTRREPAQMFQCLIPHVRARPAGGTLRACRHAKSHFSSMADETKPLLPAPVHVESLEDTVQVALAKIRSEKRQRSARFVLAALSSIPWVGGFLSAAANFASERDQGRVNDLQQRWLEEHRRKIEEL